MLFITTIILNNNVGASNKWSRMSLKKIYLFPYSYNEKKIERIKKIVLSLKSEVIKIIF